MKLKIITTPKATVIEVGDLHIELRGMSPVYVERDHGVAYDREELARIERGEHNVHEFEFKEGT